MSRIRVLLVLLLLTVLILAQDKDKRCDNGPCKEGCCSESGWCGFGPKCKVKECLLSSLY
jgi:hypothetical protein